LHGSGVQARPELALRPRLSLGLFDDFIINLGKNIINIGKGMMNLGENFIKSLLVSH
jgi:hypothetical protein